VHKAKLRQADFLRKKEGVYLYTDLRYHSISPYFLEGMVQPERKITVSGWYSKEITCC